MNYIVFDLEWNQSPNGKKYSHPQMPFEIIEIGAVRLDDSFQVTDTFHRLIRPSVYHWIHNSIRDVIHVNYRDLQSGVPFPEAARDFLDWCDYEYIFCTWGNQDVMEFQRNMDYYGMLHLLPPPVIYSNVQSLFGLQFDGEESCRSLEYATEFLHINKEMDFHRAMNDAMFTAQVLSHISLDILKMHPTLDVYQHPESKKEEIHLQFPSFSKYLSREFISREKAVKDREVTSTRCPLCGKNARRTVRWFTPNNRVYYSVSRCADHGAVAANIRIRKTADEMYFADKTIWMASGEDIDAIHRKRDAMKKKQGNCSDTEQLRK